MRLKSFHAKTMADAMRQVRQALGDDAIIVATREEEGGGVRVTAAVEDDDQHSPNSAAVSMARVPPPPPEPVVDVGEVLAEALHRHGVPAVLAEQLLDSALALDTDDPTLALGAALDSMFTFHPLPDGGRGRTKPLVLIGPHGSGKTLTVAKLAARAVFKNRSVSVISTDTVRAGGAEQLAAFTRLLKVKFHMVEDPEAFSGALQMRADNDIVLVATASHNPFDTHELNDLKALLTTTDQVEPVLVMPAGLDMVDAAETALVFRQLGARRLLVSRLDTARRLGSILVAAHRSRLAFCDGGVASKVAEGLTPLNPIGLARLMMPDQDKKKRPAASPSRSKPSGNKARAMSTPSSRTLP